jgi:hypothetical protein
MFFLQISQAPIVVWLGKEIRLKVNRFTIDEVITWAQELHDENIAKQTEGMDDTRKREYELYYRPVPPDLQLMKQYLRTPEGVKRVIKDCLIKAEVFDKDGNSRPSLTAQQINDLIKNNGAGRLSGLAIILADLDEQSALQPIADKEAGKSEDPLSNFEKDASSRSVTTGDKTGHSSSQHTRESIPVH